MNNGVPFTFSHYLMPSFPLGYVLTMQMTNSRDKGFLISNSTNNHMSFTIQAKVSNKKMKFPFIFLSPLPKSGIESSLFCKNYRNTLIIYSYYNEEDF